MDTDEGDEELSSRDDFSDDCCDDEDTQSDDWDCDDSATNHNNPFGMGNCGSKPSKPNSFFANNSNTAHQESSSAPEASSQDTLSSAEIKGVLDVHNRARAEVGISPLKWNTNLANIASQYADTLAQSCNFGHSGNGYGENLFMGTKGAFTPMDGVREWVNEKKDYDYSSNSGTGVVGHYTQVVWSRTTSVGCGIGYGCGNMFLVCNYDPAGNMNGEWPY